MKTITMSQRIKQAIPVASEQFPHVWLAKLTKMIDDNKVVSAETVQTYIRFVIGEPRVRTVRHFVGRQRRVMRAVRGF